MRRSWVVGAATVAATGLAAATATIRPALRMPLTIDLRGPGTTGLAGRTPLGVVGRGALLVPAAAAGIGLLARGRREASRTRLLVIDGVASPITVFLVAQANGVTDAGALMLTYSSTAGSVLIRGLQVRDRGGRPRELPLWAAAMVGIVPWGMIGLHQVGAGAAGSSPPAGVRVLTLTVLAAAVAEFVAGWRGMRRSAGPGTGEVVLVVVPPLLLAVLGVLALG